MTIAGLVAGVACMLYGILSGGELMSFFDPGSIFITVGGTICGFMIAYPMKSVKSVISVISQAFKSKDIDLAKDIRVIVDIANIARREGLLALENSLSTMENPFLKKGIMLVVDGSDPELIKNVLESEMTFTANRHADAAGMLDTLAAFGPAFGMIGTLIGLINMLKSMDDPDALGPGMSTALITTLYGSFLANLLFTPMSKKLKKQSADEFVEKQLLLEGLLSIQDGENPRVIEEKLRSFLSRTEISKMGEVGGPSRTEEAPSTGA